MYILHHVSTDETFVGDIFIPNIFCNRGSEKEEKIWDDPKNVYVKVAGHLTFLVFTL